MSDDQARGRELIEAMLGAQPATERAFAVARTVGGGLLLAHVVDERHPTLLGRVEIRYEDDDGHTQQTWVPTLQGLPVRFGDAVLVATPSNGIEPVVIGVVDGFSRRPEPSRRTGFGVELRSDEVVEIRDSRGRPLVLIHEGEQGPVVTLARPNVDLEVAGALRIRAESLELAATRGALRLNASDDVIVRGEIIELN